MRGALEIPRRITMPPDAANRPFRRIQRHHPGRSAAGRSSPQAARKYNAGGSKTDSVCRGKSFSLSWARCCRARTTKNRVMAAMLKMKKIGIEALKKAHEGRFD